MKSLEELIEVLEHDVAESTDATQRCKDFAILSYLSELQHLREEMGMKEYTLGSYLETLIPFNSSIALWYLIPGRSGNYLLWKGKAKDVPTELKQRTVTALISLPLESQQSEYRINLRVNYVPKEGNVYDAFLS